MLASQFFFAQARRDLLARFPILAKRPDTIATKAGIEKLTSKFGWYCFLAAIAEGGMFGTTIQAANDANLWEALTWTTYKDQEAEFQKRLHNELSKPK